jgi:hypothetical protein
MLCLGMLLQLLLIGAGLWPAVWVVLKYADSADRVWHWVLLILGALLLFNYGYLAALLVLRILIPQPKEGDYPYRPGGKIPAQAITYMLNALVVKARYETPWAAMFSAAMVNTMPLRLLFTRFFGPRSYSATLGDTVYYMDPGLIHVGKNVQLGFHCILLAHLFDNRGMRIRQIVIEDNAVIGGEAMLLPGVQVGHHSVVALRSVIPPDTIIGPYEYWAGTPATKVKDITPGDQPAAEPASALAHPQVGER